MDRNRRQLKKEEKYNTLSSLPKTKALHGLKDVHTGTPHTSPHGPENPGKASDDRDGQRSREAARQFYVRALPSSAACCQTTGRQPTPGNTPR